MRKKRATSPFVWMLAVWALSAACAAHAELADRNAPLHIGADALQYDDARKLSTFTGRVVASKGSILLRAHVLQSSQDAQGHQSVLATGQGDEPARFRQKRQGLDEWVEGQAQQIQRDEATQTVTFTGGAVLRRLVAGKLASEVSGELVVYDESTETYKVQGAGEAAGAAGRVRALIMPKATPEQAVAPLKLAPDAQTQQSQQP